jgi:hypothetical protein
VRPNIELHIEELVLEGFDPRQRQAIATALERELGALTGNRGVPPSLSANRRLAHLDGGHFDIPVGAAPDAIGVRLARALYRGFGR